MVGRSLTVQAWTCSPSAWARPMNDSVAIEAGTWTQRTPVPASMATESFVRRAQALGLQVHAWTVNDRPTMERLLDLGIDGIMTDETVALRDVLAARHQWHPRTPAEG